MVAVIKPDGYIADKNRPFNTLSDV